MKKTLFILFALLATVGAWADGTWNITSADYTTDGWSLMESSSTPDGVTALGDYTRYYRTEEITLTSAASLEVRFKYTSGSHRLDILGVDILNGSSEVVASDYHEGYTGGNMDKNTYLLNAIDAGTYTIRYIVRGYATNSQGNITINTIKYADSYENISQWYIVRVHANQAHYMYYDSGNTSTGISFTSSTADINNNNYLWGFVKNGSGVSIYNKAAGNSLAVDNSTPSKMSSDGTSVSFNLGTVAAGTYGWGADAFFSVYQTAGTYLNIQSDKLQRWWDADAGSNFMIYAVDAPANLTATLTDMNGVIYTINYEGIAGMSEPKLTGCDGYTLTNGTWSGNTYSATINFPFPVSSNNVTNYTYIGQFHNKNYYGSDRFLWHTDGTNVIVHDGDMPDNTKSEGVYTENAKYEWAITPTITQEGNITFTIKNASNGKFIFSEATSQSHADGTVTLSGNATSVTYKSTTATSTCSPIHAFCLPTGLYLSVNSVTGNATQKLGAWSAVHDGISVGFHTPADFATLDANLIAACTAFWPYSNIIGSGLGQYSGATSSDMSSAYTTATTATTLTAAQLTSLTSTLDNPASKLSLNMPTTGKFYRIKGYSTNYITSNTAGNNASMNGTASANNIIYYTADKNLIFYGSGLGMYNTHTVAPVGSNLNTYEFLQGAQIGKYYVKSNAPGVGTYCYDNTANGTKVDRNGSPVTSGSYQTDWTLEEVTSLPVTISGAGYATYCFPVNVTFNGNAKAYVATSATGNSIHFDEVEAFSAGQGILLKGTEGNYTFSVGGEGNNNDDLLSGTTAAVTVASLGVAEGSTLCAFQKSGSDYGFFKYPTAQTTFPGFKAYYIYTPSSGNAGSNFFTLSFDDDDVTAISSAINGQILNGQYYDLQGRKVVAPQKGQLYIHNGKKVLY